jgi:hypothetical protein
MLVFPAFTSPLKLAQRAPLTKGILRNYTLHFSLRIWSCLMFLSIWAIQLQAICCVTMILLSPVTFKIKHIARLTSKLGNVKIKTNFLYAKTE